MSREAKVERKNNDRLAPATTTAAKLFLDAEWADIPSEQLVSLAIVAETGEEFYAERLNLPSSPTPFAREVVYPALDRGAAALDAFTFAIRLRKFVAYFGKPVLVYNYPFDYGLFLRAIAGFGRFARGTLDAAAPAPAYEPCYFNIPAARMTTKAVLPDPIAAYFEAHPSAIEHHALHDARALRHAVSSIVASAAV